MNAPLRHQSLCNVIAVAMVALALCACATRPVPVSAAAQEGGPNDVQCHLESVTGSMFKERVCLTKAERDSRQALTDDMKTGLDRQRSIACPNGSAPPCK
jgi:hypothetical protein